MKTTSLPIILAVLAIALAPLPATAAELRPGAAAAQSGPKDYSKNAATGDYRAMYGDGLRTSSLAGTTSETAPPQRPAAVSAGGFSWGDAGIGALVGALIGGLLAAGALRRPRMLEAGR
jgi:hypothetical protein